MLPIHIALSYIRPLDRVVIIFYVTDKESGSRASYKSSGMHRVSFTPVCMAEGRLWRRLLHKRGGLSQLPRRGQRAASAHLLSFMALSLLPFPWWEDMSKLSQQSPARPGSKQSPQPPRHAPTAPRLCTVPPLHSTKLTSPVTTWHNCP